MNSAGKAPVFDESVVDQIYFARASEIEQWWPAIAAKSYTKLLQLIPPDRTDIKAHIFTNARKQSVSFSQEGSWTLFIGKKSPPFFTFISKSRQETNLKSFYENVGIFEELYRNDKTWKSALDETEKLLSASLRLSDPVIDLCSASPGGGNAILFASSPNSKDIQQKLSIFSSPATQETTKAAKNLKTKNIKSKHYESETAQMNTTSSSPSSPYSSPSYKNKSRNLTPSPFSISSSTPPSRTSHKNHDLALDRKPRSIAKHDSWDLVWNILQTDYGWTKRQSTGLVKQYYICPEHANIELRKVKYNLKMGKDYHTSLSTLQSYVRKRYGWEGPFESQENDITSPSSSSSNDNDSMPPKKKSKVASEGNSNQNPKSTDNAADDDTSWSIIADEKAWSILYKYGFEHDKSKGYIMPDDQKRFGYFPTLHSLRRFLCAYGMTGSPHKKSDREDLELWIRYANIPQLLGKTHVTVPMLLSPKDAWRLLVKIGFKFVSGFYVFPGCKIDTLQGCQSIMDVWIRLARFGLPKTARLNELTNDESLSLLLWISDCDKVSVWEWTEPDDVIDNFNNDLYVPFKSIEYPDVVMKGDESLASNITATETNPTTVNDSVDGHDLTLNPTKMSTVLTSSTFSNAKDQPDSADDDNDENSTWSIISDEMAWSILNLYGFEHVPDKGYIMPDDQREFGYFPSLHLLRRFLCAYGMPGAPFNENHRNDLDRWIRCAIIPQLAGKTNVTVPISLDSKLAWKLLMKIGFRYSIGKYRFPKRSQGKCDGYDMYSYWSRLSRFGLPKTAHLSELSDEESLSLLIWISTCPKRTVWQFIAPDEILDNLNDEEYDPYTSSYGVDTIMKDIVTSNTSCDNEATEKIVSDVSNSQEGYLTQPLLTNEESKTEIPTENCERAEPKVRISEDSLEDSTVTVSKDVEDEEMNITDEDPQYLTQVIDNKTENQTTMEEEKLNVGNDINNLHDYDDVVNYLTQVSVTSDVVMSQDTMGETNECNDDSEDAKNDEKIELVESIQRCSQNLSLSALTESNFYDGSESDNRFNSKKLSLMSFLRDALTKCKDDRTDALSMYICGAPGTGKTSMVDHCLKSVSKEFTACFVNASSLTNSTLISTICEVLGIENSLLALEKHLYNDKSPALILVIDEMDVLVSNNSGKNGESSLLDNIRKWATSLDCRLNLIGISNSVGDKSAKRLHSLFNFSHELIFEPYDESDLSHIIQRRLKDDVKVIEPPAITLVCKKVAKMSGDARLLLDLMNSSIKKCTDEIFKDGSSPSDISDDCTFPVVKLKHVMKALKESGHVPFAQIIEGLPQAAKTVLCVASVLRREQLHHTTLVRAGTLRSYCVEAERHGILESMGLDGFMDIVKMLEDAGLVTVGDGNGLFNRYYADVQSSLLEFHNHIEDVEIAIGELLLTKDGGFYKKMSEYVRKFIQESQSNSQFDV